MPRSKNRPLFFIACVAIVALLVAGAGSAAAYGILFPAVWTERLPFVNSTGQFDTVTHYRSAMDDTYDNVTRFIATVSAALEADVASDSKYRCVEYAVRLHDEAELQGLDCAVIGTGTGRETPRHALVVFMTTDNGMLFVDPTARNVSASDYPGIDFSKVLLLCSEWNVRLPYRDAAGIYPTVTEHRAAKPVSFGELEAFLARDDTEDRPYVMPDYTCLDFAVSLHDRAEAVGIQCGVVTVAFADQAEGHAFNAFPESDRGVVYVDCTGVNRSDGAGDVLSTDNIVYLQNGSELGELPVTQVNGSLDYGFYVDLKGRIIEYREQWKLYTAEVTDYNAEVAGHDARIADNERFYAAYRSECDRYAVALDEYNRQMDLHNSGVMDFNEGDTDVTIPEAPKNTAELEAWRAKLDGDYSQYISTWNHLESWRQQLISQKAVLDHRMTMLKNADESKWITYSPMGTVNNVKIYWG
jgi:hypothetical protein